MKKPRHLLVPMIMVSVLILSGCATTSSDARKSQLRHTPTPEQNATLGSSSQQAEKIPVGKAVVYIYHSGGSNHRFFLQANGKDVTSLRKGLYYAYFAEPGVIEFTAKTMGTCSVTLDTKAGQTYYLRGSVPPGFSPTPSLVLISPEVGAKEIIGYELISSH